MVYVVVEASVSGPKTFESFWASFPYRKYHIVGNFRWCKTSWKWLQTLQKKFLRFLFSRNKCVMLWPHPYQLMATPHVRTEETTLNDEPMKQESLCGDLRNYESIRTAWLVKQKDSALLISASTTSERLLRVRWHFVKVKGLLVCARKQKNGPSSADQVFSIASCNSRHALSPRGVHPPTSPCPTLSASAEPIFKTDCTNW